MANETQIVNVRIEGAVLESIDRMADFEKRSRSNMIQVLLDEAVEARNSEPDEETARRDR